MKLEFGTEATEFTADSFGDSLRKCQRYYEEIEIYNNGYIAQFSGTAGIYGFGTFFGGSIPYKVTKRATPTPSFTHDNSSFYWTIAGLTPFTNNDTTGTELLVTRDAIKLSQHPTAASSATSGNIYILEAGITLKIDAEIY